MKTTNAIKKSTWCGVITAGMAFKRAQFRIDFICAHFPWVKRGYNEKKWDEKGNMGINVKDSSSLRISVLGGQRSHQRRVMERTRHGISRNEPWLRRANGVARKTHLPTTVTIDTAVGNSWRDCFAWNLAPVDLFGLWILLSCCQEELGWLEVRADP